MCSENTMSTPPCWIRNLCLKRKAARVQSLASLTSVRLWLTRRFHEGRIYSVLAHCPNIAVTPKTPSLGDSGSLVKQFTDGRGKSSRLVSYSILDAQ